jgi:hypothetical protein
MTDFREKYINPFIGYDLKHLCDEELSSYSSLDEASLKYYRDLKNALDTAKTEGISEAIERVAINAIKMGMSVQKIIDLTGLSEDQIKKLSS